MKKILTFVLLLIGTLVIAQNGGLRGVLQNEKQEPVGFANVALYQDKELVKAAITSEEGVFEMKGIPQGVYRLTASFIGYTNLDRTDLLVGENKMVDLGILQFETNGIDLETAVVKADRALIEVKPDRMVFNVEGTINSAGQDALALLRKAPGVIVDNNDNIIVLGRTGVIIYVDGKLLPLNGADLSNYLNNLQADQIDRIDIISNPGAKYDAEGNAGIIDIQLKKDKNLGANGSVNATYSQGRYHRANTGGSGNYRNKRVNVFANGNLFDNGRFHDMNFLGRQNGFILDEINRGRDDERGYDLRLGTDFFLTPHQTIGFLASSGQSEVNSNNLNRINILNQQSPQSIDSILIARNRGDVNRERLTANVNYRYDNRKGRILNVDADWGRFSNENIRIQPNQYYAADQVTELTAIQNDFDTPSDINIYTFKVDYEQDLWGGKWSLGTKVSQVSTENDFRVFDVVETMRTFNERLSNIFDYEERVYAGYVNYSRPINQALQFNSGLRVEQTDATGDLMAFLPELQEPPVELNYLNWFPSAGLTWQMDPRRTVALNYGRRINRPDYNVLNPFNNLLSQLSYMKGNPFLRPEIVNNLELGLTLDYRYNFKVAYSRTSDQITRLIAPDEVDPRAGFMTWENLAMQTVWSFNASLPFQFLPWWSAYFNINASHLDNQADYGNGAVVDVQAFTYNIYQQHTFELPYGFKGEISGFYAGPGVWGGVFLFDPSWSLDIGLQRRFLNDQLNVRLSASDLFYEAYWSGESSFNGLVSEGQGNWDSRRVSLALSYDFGNMQIKSRKRSTGLEDEAKRIGG
jgi:iron complex outermembrane recepter protein